MQTIEIPPAIPADPAANATDLLRDRLARDPDAPLFSLPDGEGWREITTREFYGEVLALAKGLIAAGVQPGDKIGLMAKTRYEWTLIDFAAWFAGGLLVPIYETNAPDQMLWSLSDSQAHWLIVETDDHRNRYQVIADQLPAIRAVWGIDAGDLNRLAESGSGIDDAEVERRRSIARGHDIATIIYTSGSTGRPKGCVITHSNFVDLCRNAAQAMPEVVYDPRGASTLLFIPIAHVFARFISLLAVHTGVKVGHQPNTALLMASLASFKPSFLLAVPRVFEKVYNVSEQKAEAAGRGRIFHAAVATAIEHSRRRQDGQRVGLGLSIRFALFDRLVFEKLRSAMGGRVKYAVSGSAPLGARLGHFYHSLGITILEGYGLTETTAPATINRVSSSRIGSVGLPLPGVGVRIADDGEIEVRGINVFQGYWNNEQATRDTFDGEWFKTGDIGVLDDQGYLTITGRKKEIIVTAGGKNVAPAGLEDPIRANPLVAQVVVVGDRRPFIAALVTLDAEMLATWLRNKGLNPGMSLAEAADHTAVRAEVQRAIDLANSKVSRAESIRKFVILPTEWTEASGHLTPKLSIKRAEIMRDFATAVDELYQTPLATDATAAVEAV